MSRFITICTLGLISMLTLNAGQIQLTGSSTNVVGFGLSGSATTNNAGQYLQPTNGTTPNGNCAGLQYSGKPCYTASSGTGVSKGMFELQLFEGAGFQSGTTLATAPPDAAVSGATPGNSGLINSSGFTSYNGATIQFAMMNAPNGANGYVGTGTSGGSTCSLCEDANFWQGDNALVIPVGVYNVDSVSTVLDDEYGSLGQQGITVSFCFASTSNGGGAGCTSGNLVTVALTNGVEYSDSIICNSSVAGGCPANAAGAPTSSTYTLASSTANVGGSGVTVDAGVVYSSAYTNIQATNPAGGNVGPWATSAAGNVQLYDQQFLFTPGQYSGEYLSYISIVDDSSNYSGTGTLGSASRYALAAVTVDAVPEPGSLVLLLAGFGAIGLGRLRRRG
jgi:hypothetical protein